MVVVMEGAARSVAGIGAALFFVTIAAAGEPPRSPNSLLSTHSLGSDPDSSRPRRFKHVASAATADARRAGKRALRGGGDDDEEDVVERPGVQPRFSGHRLAEAELSPIYSVECLKAKQRNPSTVCVNQGGAPTIPEDVPDLSITTYPDWKEPRCRSHGEYLCDPEGLLKDGQVVALAAVLQEIRELSPVPCLFHGGSEGIGVSSGSFGDGDSGRDHRSFNLGVAFANKWPATENDPSSLQQFGMVTMANWEMQELYNGIQVNYASCPTSALLIILPDIRQAFLASPSCEFICKDRGGPEVVAATLAALDSGGPFAAAAAGAREVERVLKKTLSMSRPVVPPGTFGEQAQAWDREVGQSDEVWGTAQRILFGVIVGGCLIGLVALAGYAMSPQGTSGAFKSAVL